MVQASSLELSRSVTAPRPFSRPKSDNPTSRCVADHEFSGIISESSSSGMWGSKDRTWTDGPALLAAVSGASSRETAVQRA